MDFDVAFYIAQAISIITAVVAILSVQLKGMKAILITQIIGNSLASSTYFLLGGFSGALVSLIAVVQTVVMYFYNVREVKPHISVTAAFILAYIVNSLITFSSILDIFPAIAATCFALSVSQRKPILFRFFSIWNPLSWLIYDFYARAYGNMLMHFGIFISIIIACIRYDGFFGLIKINKEKLKTTHKEGEKQ